MLSTVFSAICLLAAVSGSIATPVADASDKCVILQEGRYTISSALNDWQLRPYYHVRAPPGIAPRPTPPTNDWGVWELASAPGNAYYILNVGQRTAVSNLGHRQPYTAPIGEAAPYEIECVGGGLYIIKNPGADEVWTANPRNSIDVIFNGATGEISQHFEFTKA